MKYLDEYRKGEIAKRLAGEIVRLSARIGDPPLNLMEVCGGHTHTIFKYGVEDLLPPNIQMIHGPGCPVCVIPLGRVDDARAGIEDEPVAGEGRRRRRADGLFAA